MSFTHTPGPWSIDPHNGDIVSGPLNVSITYATSPADRCLMAAAPELLDALEGCLHFDDAFIRDGVLGKALLQWRNAAADAIAKATYVPEIATLAPQGDVQ